MVILLCWIELNRVRRGCWRWCSACWCERIDRDSGLITVVGDELHCLPGGSRIYGRNGLLIYMRANTYSVEQMWYANVEKCHANMWQLAIPSLFQVHGISLCLDHISDPITSTKSCSILYDTEVAAGSDVFVRFKADTGVAMGICTTSTGLENAQAAIQDVSSCDTARRLYNGLN